MMEVERPREIIDEFVSIWGDIVVPLYGQVDSNVNLDGIGSGFLIEYERTIFLVTCYHVVEDLNRTDGAVGYFNGQGIDISKLTFIGDSKDDVVVAHLDREWATKNSLKKVKALPLVKDTSGYEEAGYYFFMGYPCSKNKLKMNLKKFERFLYSYSVSEKIHSSKNTKIENHSAFAFDIDSMSDTQDVPKRPPNLNGVSGGPLFSVLRSTSNTKSPKFALNLVGVFSEWWKKENEIICTNKSVVIESANHWLA